MTTDWNQVSGLIVAIGTAALAIYAALTFKGLKDQMKLLLEQAASMKRQADAMEGQSKLIRDQSDAMTRQADTEERHFTLRTENTKRDRITKEMELLIIPLKVIYQEIDSRGIDTDWWALYLAH